MKTFQKYNPKNKRWIKFKKLESGKTLIVKVSKKKMSGVPVKK